ncbi:hypothetical protein PFICI_00814 [Pestalotiopsis fici W106-1]|uniref:Glycosyltransferase family 25 protein n=1 Tax=Pestalotiopsis fici (strain W106-1 / CGMCC3.15140) TaxID=1229662 RepID=W3XNY3_PESFW|nr:uncharacterized protein PFICI_00814 [Pestalotiopsis fici W106-1]ETS86986.1 hypothetical protein PFICI_00814 [Pestalotiopsis fici W106-1]
MIAQVVGPAGTIIGRAPRKWIIATIAAFMIIALGLLHGVKTDFQSFSHNSPDIEEPVLQHPRDLATNSTLGFERLVALSTGPSWRTRGLNRAADLSGLDFTIPFQPRNPDELVHAFQSLGSPQDRKPPDGSARAWLSHLDLLKYIIASGFETALVVEDDVDWDVRIKQQMTLVSDNLRAYQETPENDTTPFGTDWDVLWLGHCGSSISEHPSKAPLVYADDTAFPSSHYLGWAQPTLEKYLGDGRRQVQTSSMTVCSFAYAVNRVSAQKVLEVMGKGANEAFDVGLNVACRDGKLRCLIVNPQLFNHYEPPFTQGYVSDVQAGDGKGASKEEDEFEQKMGTTRNIIQSARCKALFGSECAQPSNCIGSAICKELYN